MRIINICAEWPATRWIMASNFEWSLFQLCVILCASPRSSVDLKPTCMLSITLGLLPSLLSYLLGRLFFANGLFIWNRTETEYIKIFIYLFIVAVRCAVLFDVAGISAGPGRSDEPSTCWLLASIAVDLPRKPPHNLHFPHFIFACSASHSIR